MALHATSCEIDTMPPRHRLKNPFTMSKSEPFMARGTGYGSKSAPEYVVFISGEMRGGGAYRDRTDDPLLAKQVLSQLSYTPFIGMSSLLMPR